MVDAARRRHRRRSARASPLHGNRRFSACLRSISRKAGAGVFGPMNASRYDWPFFDEEHRAFATRIGDFVRDAGVVEDEAHPDRTCAEWVRAFGAAGLLRECVPQGDARTIDVRRLCVARETIGYESALGDFAFAMQGLGIGPISFFGSDEQRARYLPRVAAGDLIPAFALSERDA